jgi:GAF domain-containing protein
VLATPLLREGAPIGALIAARTEVRPFSDAQINLFETFADQAVIAIENTRLFQELQERNHELSEALEQQTATSEILRVIASTPSDLQRVLSTVAENAARLCGADDAHIFRVEGDVLRKVARYGSLGQSVPVGGTVGISRGHVGGRAVVDRQTVHLHDLATASDEFAEGKLHRERTGYRTIVATPLLRQGVPIGNIMVRRLEVRPFTDAQIELLETFADQAVIAIENTRLFGELSARVDELQALGEVGQAINSSLDLDQVLARIVEQAVALSATDAGAIYEYDEPSREFRLRATYQMSQELIELLRAARDRLSETVVGQAAATRRPVQVPDLLSRSEIPLSNALVEAGYRALLVVPLLREERIIGALVVRRRAPGEFGPASSPCWRLSRPSRRWRSRTPASFRSWRPAARSWPRPAGTSPNSWPTCPTSCERPSTPSSAIASCSRKRP